METAKARPGRDFATAGLVWIGFGVVRSLFRRRTPVVGGAWPSGRVTSTYAATATSVEHGR